MTVPLRNNSPEWEYEDSQDVSVVAAYAVSGSRDAALGAVNAALAAAREAKLQADTAGDFVDELAHALFGTLTVYQRELLSVAFTKAVDARVAAYLEGR
jgi:hypothetical protein